MMAHQAGAVGLVIQLFLGVLDASRLFCSQRLRVAPRRKARITDQHFRVLRHTCETIIFDPPRDADRDYAESAAKYRIF